MPSKLSIITGDYTALCGISVKIIESPQKIVYQRWIFVTLTCMCKFENKYLCHILQFPYFIFANYNILY